MFSSVECQCGKCHANVSVWPLHCRCGRRICQDGAEFVPAKPTPTAATSERMAKAIPCVYIGEAAGVADCDCQTKPIVYSCGVHGLCMDSARTSASLVILNGGTRGTVSHACRGCEQYEPRQSQQFTGKPITTRNLIFHIYPHGEWHDAVREIGSHIDAFNGRRIVAIASDPGMDIEAVRKFVAPLLKPTQLFVFENDKDLRETVTFEPLLRAVLNDSPTEATFYGHSKANTTDGNVDAATKWRQVMTANLLGRWRDAMGHLERHVFVGTHKLIWPSHIPSPFPTRLVPNHLWMHAGTFWWFRHDEVSRRYKPDMIARDRYAIEAVPGQLIPHEMAYSMWQPWEEHESAWPQRFPYDPTLYDEDYSR